MHHRWKCSCARFCWEDDDYWDFCCIVRAPAGFVRPRTNDGDAASPSCSSMAGWYYHYSGGGRLRSWKKVAPLPPPLTTHGRRTGGGGWAARTKGVRRTAAPVCASSRPPPRRPCIAPFLGGSLLLLGWCVMQCFFLSPRQEATILEIISHSIYHDSTGYWVLGVGGGWWLCTTVH